MKETKGQADARAVNELVRAKLDRRRQAVDGQRYRRRCVRRSTETGISARRAPARRAQPRNAARGAPLADHAGRPPLPPDPLRRPARRPDVVAARGRRGRRAAARRCPLDELRRAPAVELAATIECAGNGRALLEPRPISQPWLTEAIGTASLARRRARARCSRRRFRRASAVDVVFAGLDRGVEGEVEQRYERSLLGRRGHSEPAAFSPTR